MRKGLNDCTEREGGWEKKKENYSFCEKHGTRKGWDLLLTILTVEKGVRGRFLEGKKFATLRGKCPERRGARPNFL